MSFLAVRSYLRRGQAPPKCRTRRVRHWAKRVRSSGLDNRRLAAQDLVMSAARVREIIASASALSEDERRVVVDAIAPRESIAKLAADWEVEVARRAARVRSGQSHGKAGDEVFDRLESKLKAR
ncbi:MAG: hypothetical protein IPI67_20230 [Myxococcales bacterium]|nr:hypothetical protein [Myxococcales bacterium]